MELFRSLTELMLHRGPQGRQTLQMNQTALCYTNTIFSKLLKFQQSRVNCMSEEGYKLFIAILKHEDNKHLFLESLDCIKLFLMTRTNLEKFKEIPERIQLDKDFPELNVSFLQVLAILSFEKQNHSALSKAEFLNRLDSEGMFEAIFENFDKLIKEESAALEAIEQTQLGSGKKRNFMALHTNNSEAVSAMSTSMLQTNHFFGNKKNLKNDLNRQR